MSYPSYLPKYMSVVRVFGPPAVWVASHQVTAQGKRKQFHPEEISVQRPSDWPAASEAGKGPWDGRKVFVEASVFAPMLAYSL